MQKVAADQNWPGWYHPSAHGHQLNFSKKNLIPLRAKREGEFIKNGHKKFSPPAQLS